MLWYLSVYTPPILFELVKNQMRFAVVLSSLLDVNSDSLTFHFYLPLYISHFCLFTLLLYLL